MSSMYNSLARSKRQRRFSTTYHYKPLDSSNGEIRLVTLLPGEFDDDLHACLDSVVLRPSGLEKPAYDRMSLEDLRQTLPADWNVHETLEGRYIFDIFDLDSTSWDHPDPGFDRARYELPLPGPRSNGGPAYEALSYVWGSSVACETIYTCDPADSRSMISHLGSRKLAIGHNLAEALRHLRYSDIPRTLWIDAICIDQMDDVERSEQVRRMANVFSFAQRVLVWLGPEEDDSKLALTTISHLADQVEISIERFSLPSPMCEKRDWYEDDIELPYNDHTWKAIQCLLQRPWFRRLWVCQEIQLAGSGARIYCGHEEVPWLSLRKAVSVMHDRNHLPSESTRTCLRVAFPLMRNMKVLPWLSNLRHLCWRECSDDRDRIYAILGISPSTLVAEMNLSYSFTVSEAFKQATLAYVNHSKRLDILEHCDLAVRRIKSPSWVPDWTIELGSGFEWCGLASGFSSASINTVSNKVLEVGGVRITNISETSSLAPVESKRTLSWIRTWEPKNIHTATYLTGESLFEAFLLTVQQGQVQERFPYTDLPNLEECKSLYLDSIAAQSEEAFDALLHLSQSLNCLEMLYARKFVHTTSGHIGVSAGGTEPGKWGANEDALRFMLNVLTI